MNKKALVLSVLAFAMILSACNLPTATPTAIAVPTVTASHAMQIGGSGLPVLVISPADATAIAAETWIQIGTMEDGDQLIVPGGIFRYDNGILSYDPSDEKYATTEYASEIELDNFKFQFNEDSLTVLANGWIQRGGYMFVAK